MNWPLPQDFNEAVQNPATAFSDADLKAGHTVVGPTGLPLPRSGNFADVYQIRAANGRDWAIKCFTRPVTGLEQRYKKVDDALRKAGLPFTIDFTYLNEGVLVRGEWRPAVKMEWVDGLQLNQVVRDQAGSTKVLDALGQMWSRLCKKLRDTGIAHADLQHGNVLLVAGTRAGSYGLKLIDYDGMYVPALANTPSGESGHPNYQHPLRAAKQVYSPDLDRFPHLVIATALKGLSVLGPKLWERYDTGDNLLFTEDDFKAPASSKLMKELWLSNNPGLQALVGHLALACGKPIPQTPWLDQIAPDGIALPLSPEEAKNAALALGLGPVAVKPVSAAEYGVEAAAPANAFADLDANDKAELLKVRPRRRDREEEEDRKKPVPKAKSPMLPIAIAVGVLLIASAVVGGIMLTGDKKPDETVQNNEEKKEEEKPKPKPKEKEKERLTPPDPKPPDKEPIIPPMPPEPGPGPAPKDPGAFSFDPAGVPELTKRWEGFTRGNSGLARFTATGDWVIARDDNNSHILCVFSAKTGAKMPGFTEGETTLVDYTCLADGNVVSWHADQPFAIVWKPSTGKPIGKIPVRSPGFAPGPKLFDVSPDGRYVVTGHAAATGPKGEAGRVALFDTQTSKEVLTTDVRSPKFRFFDDKFFLADIDKLETYSLPSGKAGRFGKFDNPPRLGKMAGVSADGNFVLHPGRGRDLNLVDCRTGKPIVVLPNRFPSSHAALSDDGRLVAACSFPSGGDALCYVEVLDVGARKLLGRYPLNPGALDVSTLAFAPDNSTLVITRSGRRVQAIDLPKPGAVAVVPKDPGPPFVPLAPGVVPPSPDKIAIRQLAARPADPNLTPTKMAISPDGKTVILSGMRSAELATFDMKTVAAGPGFRDHQDKKYLFWFGALTDGKVWSIAKGETAAAVWDTKTGKSNGSIRFADVGGNEDLQRYFVSPDGRYAAHGRGSFFREGDYEEVPVKITDLKSGKDLVSIEWRSEAVYFTGDSSRVLVFDTRGGGRWFKLPSGAEDGGWKGELRPDRERVESLAMSWDGRWLLCSGSVDRQGVHFIVDARTGKTEKMLGERNEFLTSKGALSADGRYAALLRGQPGELVIMDVATGRVVDRTPIAPQLSWDHVVVGLAPDARSVAVYDRDQGLRTYELSNQAVAVVPKPKDPDPMPKDPPGGNGFQAKWTKDLAGQGASLFFSADGKHLFVTQSEQTSVEGYDVETGAAGAVYKWTKRGMMRAIVKLDDGRVFADTGIGEVLAWDFKTGDVLASPIKPEWFAPEKARSQSYNVMSPNGQFVFSARIGPPKMVEAGKQFEYEQAPYRLTDTGDGKNVNVLSTSWQGGTALFTRDSKWLVIHDSGGSFRRMKPWSGSTENSWNGPPTNALSPAVFGINGDATAVLFHGALKDQKYGFYVVDARTGAVIQTLPEHLRTGWGAMTEDGKHAGVVRIDVNRAGGGPLGFSALVIEVETGKIVSQAAFDMDINRVQSVQFSPDLKRFAVSEGPKKSFSVYEFKDGAVAVVPKPKDPPPMPKDPVPPAPKVERKPVPDDAALAKAEMKLRGLLKDDYARKLPAERRALAVKLLGLTDDAADDPATRFVMYRDARDIAIEVSDPSLAMQGLDGIIRNYVVDADALRLAAFEKIKDTAGNNTALKAIVDMAIASSDIAMAKDDYALASKFAQTALAAAKRGNLPAAVHDEAEAQVAKAQKGAELFAPVKDAIARLQAKADDHDAAYIVGRYRCCTQGRWDEGLPALAKGATAAMKAAAERDAAAPRNAPADVKLADAWWDAAQAATDLDKLGALYRARYWYARALPALTGDARTQAETRLGFTSGTVEYRGGLLAEFTAKVPAILQGKKARLDAVLDFNAGEFKAEGAGVATDLSVRWTGVLAPQRPGRYKFILAATDPATVRIDGKVVLDTNAKTSRRDVLLALPDRPVTIVVEFKCINTDKHSVKLLWSIPGTDTEEVIPPEVFYHDRKAESVLGKSP